MPASAVAIHSAAALARGPAWSVARFVPRIPGRIGALVSANLREMLTLLDPYLALLISLSATAWRFFGKADPAALPILALLVAVAISTYAQCLFALETASGMTRYRLLPLRGWQILIAKDVAFLGLLLLLTLPLDPRAGMAFGLAALAIGRYPSLKVHTAPAPLALLQRPRPLRRTSRLDRRHPRLPRRRTRPRHRHRDVRRRPLLRRPLLGPPGVAPYLHPFLQPSDSHRKRHTAIAPKIAVNTSSAAIGPSASWNPHPRHTSPSNPSTAHRVGTAKLTFCSHCGKRNAGTQLPPSITSSSVTRIAIPREASGVLPSTATSSPNAAVIIANATQTPRNPRNCPRS